MEQLSERTVTDDEFLSYEPVSQEGFDIQPVGGKPGIITWGIYPCIIISFYNPKFGIYLCHTLKYNFFFKDKISTACSGDGILECVPRTKKVNEPKTNEERENIIRKLKIPVDCKGSSISESFPKWIHENNTNCYMYAHTENGISDTLGIRYNQLKQVYKGVIKQYVSDKYDRVILLQDGTFFASSQGFGDFPDELKNKGKEKDMLLFRTQLSYYFQKQKELGNTVGSIEPTTYLGKPVNITKYLNDDFTFKDSANNITNRAEFQTIAIQYGERGYIYRECLIQQGGKRRLKNKTKKSKRPISRRSRK